MQKAESTGLLDRLGADPLNVRKLRKRLLRRSSDGQVLPESVSEADNRVSVEIVVGFTFGGN